MKERVLLLTVVIFSLLQGTNLLVSFLNNCDKYIETLAESEDSEKNCKEEIPTDEWYDCIHAHLFSSDYAYMKGQMRILHIIPSKSYLTKPETPPPNQA